MKVNSLEMKNFRAIRDMRIEFDPRLNVLVGVNGAGKSSVLNCLAILLSRFTWRIVFSKKTGRFFSIDDIYRQHKKTENTISIEIFGNEYEWTATKTTIKERAQTVTNQDDIKKLVGKIHEMLEEDENSNIPLAVLYSTNRSVVKVPLKVKKKHSFTQVSALDDSLSGEREEADFKLFFEWFRLREDVENENRRYQNEKFKPDDWEFPDRQLEAVREAVSSFLPDFQNLQVRRKPALRMVVNKSGREFRIEQLSDGEKCFLALVGDIARRLAIANPSLDDPLLGEGVVLIDEVDLHLHPAWQRMIMPRLLKTFPNCQFIVTTHSPQVLGEIDAKHIHILSVEENGEIKLRKPRQAKGLTSNDILEEIMKPEWASNSLIRNQEVENRLHAISMLIDKERFGSAREAIEKLKIDLNGSIPELVEAETTIAFLE
jgi:predicted ATP-binding protein involved in virulence